MSYWNNGPQWPTPDTQKHVCWQHEDEVPLEVSLEAWKEYAEQGHGDQSHERLLERGGFGAAELAVLLFQRIKRLEQRSPLTVATDDAG